MASLSLKYIKPQNGVKFRWSISVYSFLPVFLKINLLWPVARDSVGHVVRKLGNVIHRINRYPVDKC